MKKKVDLGLDNYEIPFRVGVLQDLLDNAGKARLEYLNLLKLIGVEDAHQQFISTVWYFFKISTSWIVSLNLYLKPIQERTISYSFIKGQNSELIAGGNLSIYP